MEWTWNHCTAGSQPWLPPSITWRAFKNTFPWAPSPKSLIQSSRVGPRVVFCKSSPNVSNKHPKMTTTSVLLFLWSSPSHWGKGLSKGGGSHDGWALDLKSIDLDLNSSSATCQQYGLKQVVYSLWVSGSTFVNVGVFISNSCCNKLPQTWWL